MAISSVTNYYEAATALRIDLLITPKSSSRWELLVKRYTTLEKLYAEAAKELRGRDVQELQELEQSYTHFLNYFGNRPKESTWVSASQKSTKHLYTSSDKKQDMNALKKLEQMLEAPNGTHSLPEIGKVYVTMTAKTQRLGYRLLCQVYGSKTNNFEKDGMVHFIKIRKALLSLMVYQDQRGRIIDHLRDAVDSKYSSVKKGDFSTASVFLSKICFQLYSLMNDNQETAKELRDTFLHWIGKPALVFLSNYNHMLNGAMRVQLQDSIEVYIENRLTELERFFHDLLAVATPKQIKEAIDDHLESYLKLRFNSSARVMITKVCIQFVSFIKENQKDIEKYRSTFKQLIAEFLVSHFLDFRKFSEQHSLPFEEAVESYIEDCIKAFENEFYASIDENSTAAEIEGFIKDRLAFAFSQIKKA